jgi:4-amino-4-deoxy-L-arabinose transferase-like glycosyltransferase
MTKLRASVVPEVITIIAICLFLFFYGAGSFGLVGADEPRYAQIAREMLQRHDWVTPVLNGIPWLEKPVLYYWGAMISYSIFGVSDWAARVPTAFLTTLMVLAIYAFMRRFHAGSEGDAALITASLAGVIGFGRAASTDMPLAATFTIAMLAWYAWHETQSKRFLVVFYGFMALAVLAKGPVAPFLAGLIIVVFAALRREWTLVLKTLWIPGILLFLVIALPWFVLVQRANSQFLHVFIFEHNLARFSTDMFRHKQPFWYFIPVLMAGLLPWLVFAISAFVRAMKAAVRERSSFQLFFVMWAALPVIFFSASQSKLPGYILPAVPPFAILAAEYVWSRISESDEPPLWMTALHASVVGALFGSALLTNYFVLKLRPTPPAIWISVIGGLLCFVAIVAAVYGKGVRLVRIATVVPIILALAFVLRFASPAIDGKESERSVAHEIDRLAPTESDIAVYKVPRQVEYGLNFYANRAISRYERGEIPASAHVVVAPQNSRDSVQLLLPKRTVSSLGQYLPQKLEFYLVSSR